MKKLLKLPSNGLKPILELGVAFGGYLKCGSRCQYDAGEILIIGGRQVVQLLVNTLNVPGKQAKVINCVFTFKLVFLHLLAFLNERR